MTSLNSTDVVMVRVPGPTEARIGYVAKRWVFLDMGKIMRIPDGDVVTVRSATLLPHHRGDRLAVGHQ